MEKKELIYITVSRLMTSKKNCSGVKCNHLFTYKNITVPKPGERFKAIYSLGFDFRNQRNIPVLEEIDIVPFNK